MENVLEDEYDDSFLSPNHQKIAELNDQFRKSFCGGKIFMTCGIDALDWATKAKIISKVQKFNEFNLKNDPHGEHDFGIVQEGDVEAYWKIDYYDKTLTYGSENPADESITTRVLTILLPIEY